MSMPITPADYTLAKLLANLLHNIDAHLIEIQSAEEARMSCGERYEEAP